MKPDKYSQEGWDLILKYNKILNEIRIATMEYNIKETEKADLKLNQIRSELKK